MLKSETINNELLENRTGDPLSINSRPVLGMDAAYPMDPAGAEV